MEKFENNGIITVNVKVAHVRYAVNKDGECVVLTRNFFGMNAEKAAALVKKENKRKVIILDKTHDVIQYDVVGGTFIPSEEPEEAEE